MFSRRLVMLLVVLSLPLALAHPNHQNDGGSGDDAADQCHGDLVVIEIDGGVANGRLDPPQDHRDFYALEVDADDVGANFTVSIDGHHEMVLDVYTPECGRSVVASSNGNGHANDDGAGHANCDAPGHQGDAACDTEGGSRDELDGSITFTPSQAGHYVARVSIAPNVDTEPTGPIDFTPSNCHLSCMSYSLVSTRDSPTFVD